MSDSKEFETLLVQHLDHVKRVTHFLCRRHGFSVADTEDCLSWVQLKLVEDDYAVLRKFRGESNLRTFLTVVITMSVRDYRVQRWGRWRASAAAKRRGPLAVRLETLLYRDGLGFDAAVQQLRTSEAVSLSDREMVELFRALPARGPLRPTETSVEVLDELGEGIPPSLSTDSERETVERAIKEQLDALDAEDRSALQLHYFQGLSVADVARGLGVPQKPLYRRMERLLATMRRRLELAGITRERATTLLEDVQ
jgi:RNA polymerase sigma factor (sigma-70 family)